MHIIILLKPPQESTCRNGNRMSEGQKEMVVLGAAEDHPRESGQDCQIQETPCQRAKREWLDRQFGEVAKSMSEDVQREIDLEIIESMLRVVGINNDNE
jgi:hypothetical protein